MVTPFAQRLFATNCIESYVMLPRFCWFMLKLVNAGNGRASSNADSVGLVNRLVPSNPWTPKNGFVTCRSHSERLPPFVTSHCAWYAADGSL
jgi:hypothetical protein